MAMWRKVCFWTHTTCNGHPKANDVQQGAEKAAAAANRAAAAAQQAASAANEVLSAVHGSSVRAQSVVPRVSPAASQSDRAVASATQSSSTKARHGAWRSRYPPTGRMTPLPPPDPNRFRNPSPPSPPRANSRAPIVGPSSARPSRRDPNLLLPPPGEKPVPLYDDDSDGVDDAALMLVDDPPSLPPPSVALSSTLASISSASSLSASSSPAPTFRPKPDPGASIPHLKPDPDRILGSVSLASTSHVPDSSAVYFVSARTKTIFTSYKLAEKNSGLLGGVDLRRSLEAACEFAMQVGATASDEMEMTKYISLNEGRVFGTPWAALAHAGNYGIRVYTGGEDGLWACVSKSEIYVNGKLVWQFNV
ncbi:hypothetical protein MVEN_00023600 [Mycena venus]|uniref:Uncharacterized protein n=1 Tax=Mycena venus TaxID=2733690 RepID=A0A8H6Z6V2_9AGAR|nr:hypothetical protein MVEN_00023600 [Mycena venus]